MTPRALSVLTLTATLAAGLPIACRANERADAASSVAQGGNASPARPGQAPGQFRVRFETSAGDFVIEVHRDWAPLGADRFHTLVTSGFYDGVRFFRVLPGFMAQFGINGDPRVMGEWRDRRIPDDPVRRSNTRGMVTFATAGPHSRTTQVFINYGDNGRLDGSGFAPFGQVVEGMEVVDRLFSGYGEGAPRGRGPDQSRIQAEGNAYLERGFPELDFVKRATLVAP
jgi:peptidyl-prolyl cis-trans isomerase A (cyclophilin A)